MKSADNLFDKHRNANLKRSLPNPKPTCSILLNLQED